MYYVSIVGREKPEYYDWEFCNFSRKSFEKKFLNSDLSGIGYVISFPHITKVYRFSPFAETIVDVSEYKTMVMVPIDCSRGDGFHEFACFAEAAISGEEYRAWARSQTIEEYLDFRCDLEQFPIVTNTKLKGYWHSR